MSAASGRTPAIGEAASDDELMRRVQRDDVAAFSELYDRHSTKAYRVAMASCRRTAIAEDAVQEGFISIWQSRRTFDSTRGRFAPWAMTIVRHEAVNLARQAGTHDQRRADAGLLDVQVAPIDVAEDAIASDEGRRLRDRIAEFASIPGRSHRPGVLRSAHSR